MEERTTETAGEIPRSFGRERSESGERTLTSRGGHFFGFGALSLSAPAACFAVFRSERV